MAKKQAIIFDVEDVLVSCKEEFYVSVYNLYKRLKGEKKFLVKSLSQVPKDFIQAYTGPDKWANRLEHRLGCFYCIDHGTIPKTRKEFEDIMQNFDEAEKRKAVEELDKIRDELTSEKGWYKRVVRPFEEVQQSITAIAKQADIFVSTTNPKSLEAVKLYFPEIIEKNMFTNENETKAQSVKRVLGMEYSQVHFIDDNFSHVQDVVDSNPQVQGYVNDWGRKFTREDLTKEPSLKPYIENSKIKIINIKELQKIPLN